MVLLLLGGVLLLMEVVRNAINWVRTVQAELLQDHITALIHEKSVTVDLAFYELSDYYDHLHRARTEARYRPVALLGNLGALLQNSITLVAMGAILIPLGPWLALALCSAHCRRSTSWSITHSRSISGGNAPQPTIVARGITTGS